MNDQDLQTMKREYIKTKAIKKKIENLAIEKREVEQTEEIKKYLQIVSKIVENRNALDNNYQDITDESILSKVLENISLEEPENIYMYFETYDFNNNEVDFKDINAKYSKYKNIESNIIYEIPICERSIFENNNIILYPLENVDKELYFNLIRNNYFKIAIEADKEAALSFVKSK